VGTALPFGNSKEMPFIKQFFIGGTNSIRAFRARSIGPGSYLDPAVNTDGFLADQSGDIKIELNTEYRASLFSFVKGAAFIDAGNIWLLNENKDKPGAKFSKNFMKEMAVGAGLGLRFDFNFWYFERILLSHFVSLTCLKAIVGSLTKSTWGMELGEKKIWFLIWAIGYQF